MYDWIHILEVSPNDKEFEGLTLKKLYEHVSGINNDRMVKSVNSWRHQMEWGVIDQWQGNRPLEPKG